MFKINLYRWIGIASLALAMTAKAPQFVIARSNSDEAISIYTLSPLACQILTETS
jgi:hypothetical protein